MWLILNQLIMFHSIKHKMDYSILALTTVADCDNVLAMVEKEKKELVFKKLSLEHLQENYASNTIEVSAELEILTAELNAVNMVVAALPEGEVKEDSIKKQKKLEYKLFLLSNRKANYGAIALLEKEFNIARVMRELEEADACIAAVTAQKSKL